MGIKHLTGFLEDKYKGWKEFNIPRRSSVVHKLVIDGLSLCHHLYDEQKPKNGTILGGDYVSFANHIRDFFNTLEEHNINPFVIFDGPDIELAKNKTQDTNRRNDTSSVVTLCHNLLDTGQVTRLPSTDDHDPPRVKPYLIFDVMIQVVQSILGDSDPKKNRYMVSSGNADVCLAKMGRQYNCRVLSDDSDFFVFPLQAGFIPYSKFNWRNADRDGRISFWVYYYQDFLKQFNICEERLLSLIPAIAGNATLPRLESYRWTILQPGKRLIRWAINHAASRRGYDEACKTAKRFCPALDYNLKEAYSEYFTQIIVEEEVHSDVELCKELRLKFSRLLVHSDVELCKQLRLKFSRPVVTLVIDSIQTGKFPKLLVDALIFSAVSLRVPMEDISMNSCHSIGEPIRGLIYTIMREGVTISENQRQKENSYCKKDVKPQQLSITLPKLKDYNFTEDGGKMVLYSGLETTESQFTEIDLDHRLLLAITRYWYTKSEVKRKDIFLQSFLLFLQKPLEKAVAQSTTAAGEYNPQQDLQILHAIAEWQSLYYSVHCLNQLLQMPLRLLEPSIFLQCSNLHSYIEAVHKAGVDRAIDNNSLKEAVYEKYYKATTSALPIAKQSVEKN